MLSTPVHNLKGREGGFEPLVFVVSSASRLRILETIHREDFVDDRNITLKHYSLKTTHAEVLYDIEVVGITLDDHTEDDDRLNRRITLHESSDTEWNLQAARNDMDIGTMTSALL